MNTRNSFSDHSLVFCVNFYSSYCSPRRCLSCNVDIFLSFQWLIFLGITVDSEDILLVSVKDSMKNPNAVEKEDPPPESDNEDAKSVVSSKSSRKRGKKRRQSSNNDDDDDGGGDHDAISEPKTPRNDSDYDTNSLLATPNTSRTAPAASAYSGADDSRTSFGNQSGEGFTLTEMKQDYEDDDESDDDEESSEEEGTVDANDGEEDTGGEEEEDEDDEEGEVVDRNPG